ncbi:MAG TPA: DUF937 domain-containing protein [Thermoanaerobaculia bacterium]|nr:DUF937 domain-containing protein [Thermoanaerobaculia bacterium]
MSSILETLQNQLGPDTVQQTSRSLGADPNKTANALSLAVPALLGGLSRNASDPQGAVALDKALDDHDGSVLDNLGGLLGGGAASGAGGAILGHIFRSNRDVVEQGVGKASGLNTQQVGQMLTMLAPIVMGVLGRAKQQSGLDASQLPGVLQQTVQESQKQTPALAGITAMLDANHDGQIADDVVRVGKSFLGNLFGKS